MTVALEHVCKVFPAKIHELFEKDDGRLSADEIEHIIKKELDDIIMKSATDSLQHWQERITTALYAGDRYDDPDASRAEGKIADGARKAVTDLKKALPDQAENLKHIVAAAVVAKWKTDDAGATIDISKLLATGCLEVVQDVHLIVAEHTQMMVKHCRDMDKPLAIPFSPPHFMKISRESIIDELAVSVVGHSAVLAHDTSIYKQLWKIPEAKLKAMMAALDAQVSAALPIFHGIVGEHAEKNSDKQPDLDSNAIEINIREKIAAIRQQITRNFENKHHNRQHDRIAVVIEVTRFIRSEYATCAKDINDGGIAAFNELFYTIQTLPKL